jgi:hypothetical protein
VTVKGKSVIGFKKKKGGRGAGGVAQVVEGLPSKALSSKPSTIKKQNKPKQNFFLDSQGPTNDFFSPAVDKALLLMKFNSVFLSQWHP